MSVPDWPAMSAWALPRSAWPISIALHVLIVIALSRIQPPVAEVERRFEGQVLRFELRPRSSIAPPAAPAATPAESLDEVAVPAGIVRRRIEPTPAPEEAVADEPAADDVVVLDERTDEFEEIRVAEPAPVPGALEPGPRAAPRVDFEAIRKEAVAGVLEQAERDAAYRTFSLSDLVEEPLPEDSENVPSVFDAESSGRSRSGPLSPGRQRTAFGRRMAEICSDLGGIGVSLFGIGLPLCAEPGARADAFGHLRPQYMNSLPVCTEVEVAETEAPDVQDSSSQALLASADSDDAEPVIKCRLVPREERMDGARPERGR